MTLQLHRDSSIGLELGRHLHNSIVHKSVITLLETNQKAIKQICDHICKKGPYSTFQNACTSKKHISATLVVCCWFVVSVCLSVATEEGCHMVAEIFGIKFYCILGATVEVKQTMDIPIATQASTSTQDHQQSQADFRPQL